jgi:hypothetical protein
MLGAAARCAAHAHRPRVLRAAAALAPLLLLLCLALRPQLPPPPPRAFVPLPNDLHAARCDWRASVLLPGPPPADAVALVSALRDNATAWAPVAGGDAAVVTAPCAGLGGCHVLVRSAPVFLSRGALAFAAGADQAREHVKRLARAC